MKGSSRKYWIVLIVVALGLVVWVAPASAGVAASPDLSNTPSMSCESLKNLGLKDTTITLAVSVPANGFTPPGGPFGPPPQPVPVAFCRVVGVIKPTSVSNINFEVWMPPTATAWNGKYNGVGNGGLAGNLSYSDMANAVALGYATASTDTGHVDPGFGAPQLWATNRDLLVDFASRSIHLTAVDAKAIIAAFYGTPAKYSYFTGCSGGGGQALSEAQRYPEDYNGISAGAPANMPTHMWPGELYAAWVNRSNPANDPNSYIITADKLPIINAAVVAACDAKDGVKDGLIDDPRRCNFNPATIVCKAGQTSGCITAAQAEVVKKVYAGLQYPTSDDKSGRGQGPDNRGAKLFWPGYEPGSEFQWWGHVGDPFFIPPTYFQYMIWGNKNYPGYPGAWTWNTFDFSLKSNFDKVLYPASADLGKILDSKNTDLSAFVARGGKLIMWHGWNDQNIAPLNSIAYYTAMEDATKWGRGKDAGAVCDKLG